jgi:hypothetical protein
MKEQYKKFFKLWPAGVAILIVVAVLTGGFYAVKAFQSDTPPTMNVETMNVENMNIYGAMNTEDGVLGGTTAASFTAADLVSNDDLTVADDTTMTGDLTVSGATDVSTFTQGGGTRATSTSNSAETLLASDFDVENYIAYTPNVQTVTLTLPASSTLSSFAPNAGDVRKIVIENATTTNATGITIAAGTGIDLQVASTTNTFYGNTSAILTFIRDASSDFIVFLNPFWRGD